MVLPAPNDCSARQSLSDSFFVPIQPAAPDGLSPFKSNLSHMAFFVRLGFTRDVALRRREVWSFVIYGYYLIRQGFLEQFYILYTKRFRGVATVGLLLLNNQIFWM